VIGKRFTRGDTERTELHREKIFLTAEDAEITEKKGDGRN
jgi:hypothetical protein